MTMSELQRFSARNGYGEDFAEVTIREDAPQELRHFVIRFAEDSGLLISGILEVVCNTLMKVPEGNWGEEYIRKEVQELLLACPWYKVYDVAESLHEHMKQRNLAASNVGGCANEAYAQKFNQFCLEKGIGWQFQNGKVIARGTGISEAIVQRAKADLLQSGHQTAHNELYQAYIDISKRPVPDLTGAVQHSLAALECTAKEISGLQNATLGDIVKKSPQLFPPPLNEITVKIWGFASQKGRHLREGQTPSFAEAMLMIGLSAAIASFLSNPSGEKK